MPFLNSINRSFQLTATILKVLQQLATQKKFLKQHIEPVLESHYLHNDGSLGISDLDKINRYYGLAVPAILGEAFCILRGKKMTINERWASTCQGAMTGLFDDFFDKDYLANEHIEQILAQDHHDESKRSNQKLFEVFYGKALEHTPNKELLKNALREVYHAQVESKKQDKSKLPADELLPITLMKGGSSVAFYRTVFFPEATEKEMKVIYDLGSLMQLANDIFDVYKDRESRICTLVTETTHIRELRNLFMQQLEHHYSAAGKLGFPPKNIRRFLNILSIGIFSRCLVCLDQLESNEKMSEGIFDVSRYSRKQLICDMDKPASMLRSALKHIKEIP